MRKKIGRICALVVVGMFVAMTPMSVSAQPNPNNWCKWGDNTNGWEFLGTTNLDDLRVVTGGVQRMVVTSGGNVGIGTPLPAATLHVAGGVVIDDFLKVDAGTLYVNNINHRVGIGTGGPTEALDVVGNIHASGELIIGNSIRIDGVNDRITATGGTIDFDNENLVTTGDVGIGILNPQFTLDVDGDIHASNSIRCGNSISLFPPDRILSDTGNIILGRDDGNGNFDEDILVGIGTLDPLSELTIHGGAGVNDAAVTWDVDGTDWYMGVDDDDFDKLIIGTGAEVGANPWFTIYHTFCHVGIGTQDPNHELHINNALFDHCRFQMTHTTTGAAINDGFKIQVQPGLEVELRNYENSDMEFWTNDEVRMTIEADGNIGIGTPNPAWELQVEGTIQADALKVGDCITINGTDDKITATSGTIDFDDEILVTKGKVGIGTPTPQYKLDVEGYVEAYGYYTGDIIFQKEGEKHWRMFEDVDGLYLENLETGKVYEFVLHEKKK